MLRAKQEILLAIQLLHQDCHVRETSPLKKGLLPFVRDARREDLKMRRKKRKLVMNNPQHH